MKTDAWRIWGATAAVVALLCMSGEVRAQGPGQYRLSGDRIAVYNLAGEVEIRGGSGSDVQVEVRRGGDDQDQLEVKTGEIRGHQTLRVIYPEDRIVYPGRRWSGQTTMRIRDDGTWGEGGGGHRVRISGSGRGLEAFADLTISLPPGKEFSMYLGVGEIRAENIDGRIRLDTGSGGIVASGLQGAVVLDTGSGSVDVQDVKGDLLVDTGSGGVDVNDVTGGDLDIDTGSGSVRGAGLTAKSLRVDTGSGSVRLDRLSSPDIYVDTGSGSVELDLLSDADRIDIDTGSGGVTLRVPSDFGAEVELETGSGGIDVDLPVRIDSIKRDYLRGVIGDGDGRVLVDTGSGGVHIRKR